MKTSESHYDDFLAGFYDELFGGAEGQYRKATQIIEELKLKNLLSVSMHAIDMGCGTGHHARALAQSGFEVHAVDNSAAMIGLAAKESRDQSISWHHADIRNFETSVSPSLIVCLGDTLSHLQSEDEVKATIRLWISLLCESGCLVLSLRNYSTLPQNTDRFLLVQSSEHRIFNCFLEDEGSHVRVTDIVSLYENGWRQIKSSYRKVKIAPALLQSLADENSCSFSSHNLGGMPVYVLEKRSSDVL